MKFTWFNLMPWPHLPDDFRADATPWVLAASVYVETEWDPTDPVGEMDYFAKLKAEVERDTSAWGLAELYEAQHVLDPRDTRAWLIRTLEIHRKGMKNGVGDHLLRNWPTSY